MASPDGISEKASPSELSRRHKAIRQLMQQEGFDLLVFQANSQRDSYGYVRYVSNYVISSFYCYLLFPLDGEMTFIGHYPAVAEEAKAFFDIKDSHSVPWNPTNTYAIDAVHAAKLIADRRPKRVGLLPFKTLSAAFHERLTKELPKVPIADATELVDRVMMIKSAEEQRLIEKSAAIGDLAMETFVKVAKPGRTLREIVADVDHELKLAGSEDQFYLCGTAPAGTLPAPGYFNRLDHTLKSGNVGTFLAEISGPGGYWTDTIRTYSVGPAPAFLEQAARTVITAQHEASRHLVKDGSLKSAHAAMTNELKGYWPIPVAYGHGQGINIYERPTIHPDDTTSLKPGMEFSVHPHAYKMEGGASLSDNYIVTENGPKRWQKTPQELMIIK